MNLTNSEFWENYWRNIILPCEVDKTLSFDRCLSSKLKERLNGIQGDALEVGCAPGKWLTFLANELNFRVSGIEYSQQGLAATKKNFEILGLQEKEFLCGDFFQIEPSMGFDLVISLGFIEHFDDPISVIRRHLDWLKPGGSLVLGVPNFRGIYWALQQMLDPKVLALHNLSVMQRSFFEQVAKALQLEISSIEYLGSFEPSLPMQTGRLAKPLPFLAKLLIHLALPIRSLNFFDSLNHPWLSSYLLAIYRKP